MRLKICLSWEEVEICLRKKNKHRSKTMVQDILLDPNLQYLFLVTGFSLALMAIFTPGTGLLEIGALFGLLLAGYGIYNLPVNYWALAILILGVLPFVWAVRRSRQMIYLGISIFALVLGSVFLFQGDTWWKPAVHPVLAIVVSLFVGGFFWIVARKSLEAFNAKLSHDLTTLVGSLGEAKSDIHLEGSAQVLGELWAVRSENPISNGSVVRVIGREGFVLDVEEVSS
jgi:membrane-bound serine protease (ClpP class)